MSRNHIMLFATIAIFLFGVLSFLFMGETLQVALMNTLQTMTLVSYGAYHPATWVELTLLILSALLMLALGAAFVEWLLAWRSRDVDGSGSYRGRRGHIIVDAIDWEKVRSIIIQMQGGDPKKRVNLVVVSETLDNLPGDLLKLGVYFVKGNLRSKETYLNAGLERARGAIICSTNYENPKIGDQTTCAYVELLEHYNPDIITVAEVIVSDNLYLFPQVDHSVVFDPIVLKAVAREIANQLGGCKAHIDLACMRPLNEAEMLAGKMRVVGQFVDELQKGEFLAQLEAAGVEITDDGGVVTRVLLPSDLNDPKKSDIECHAAALLHKQDHDGVLVPVYLSIESRDLFVQYPNAICVDEVMAVALVAALMSGPKED